MTIRDIFKKLAKEKGWPEDTINLAGNQAGMPGAVDQEIEGRGGMTKAQMEEHLTNVMRGLYESDEIQRH
jgi:hypothetical protein